MYWVEVHPANPREVGVVLEKLESLLHWLRTRARELDAMKRAFIWISSGSTSFSERSPQARRMSQAKLRNVGSYFTIPPRFVAEHRP